MRAHRHRALLADAVAQHLHGVGGGVDGDGEGDGAEALAGPGGLVGGLGAVQLDDHRGAHDRVRELRVGHLAGGEGDLAESGGGLQAGLDVRVDEGAEQRVRAGVVAEEAVDGAGEVGGHLVVGLGPLVGADAVAGDQQVLRGGAHLAAVEGERERQVGEHAPVVVGRLDDHRVDAGLLGEDLGLAGVGLQPVAEGGGAGVVDDPDLGAGGQGLGDALTGALGGERDQIRVEAGLGEHVAGDLDGERERQHRAGVRLDQDRVAGGEGGEQARVAVPRREGVAADHQADTARDRRELLGQRQRVALALRLGPLGRVGRAGLLRVRVRHGLQAAVLGVRAARLERHHERLPGGVHDRLGELHRAVRDPLQDLQADHRAGLRSRVPPRPLPGPHRGQQHVEVRVRVLHAQLDPVRGDLAADPAVGAGLAEVEAGAEQGVEGRLARGRVQAAVLPVGLGVLGVGGPVRAGADRLQRLVQGRPVPVDQLVRGEFGGHAGPTPRLFRTRCRLRVECPGPGGNLGGNRRTRLE
ncbi:hypothetical protein ACVILE_003379 [Streptomyces sp. M18.1]